MIFAAITNPFLSLIIHLIDYNQFVSYIVLIPIRGKTHFL